MNIIKTPDFEDAYLCSICHDNFKEDDIIWMIKHFEASGKPEKISCSKKRKHLFHRKCLMLYIDSLPSGNETLCPMDREKIYALIIVKYYEIVALNLVNFSHNYYELLDKYAHRDQVRVSIRDRSNLNYKDDNGKTLLYCACQRGNLRMTKKLVNLGGHPCLADNEGFTPLMAAVCHNYVRLVRYLINLPEVSSQINQTDRLDLTAIEYAHKEQNWVCLKALLGVKGLDPEILRKILNQIQYLRNPLIREIISLIRKYLKIQAPKVAKPHLLPVSQPNSIIRRQQRSNEPNVASRSIINEIENNPEFFQMIYHPLKCCDARQKLFDVNNDDFRKHTEKDHT